MINLASWPALMLLAEDEDLLQLHAHIDNRDIPYSNRTQRLLFAFVDEMDPDDVYALRRLIETTSEQPC